ncbi:hypothetical protein D3875_21000 [Deinococcus cavernae]|uniref:Uncharacterized protein n=1 Tax=Deinococcus cavernae TaxID=2320857 RepID=A0A418V0S9_9DEIO|nr:hypothetical protein [Deinococcus cavernae]RJF69447.1 hypothetical protein D3875_21000 [Deinococcus cavernae]
MRPEDRSLEYAAQAARSGLHGLLFVAVFIVLQRVSFLFQDAGGVSLWYLPAGLSLAYLMRSGRRNVGWVFVAIAGAGWLQSPVAVNHLAALFGVGAQHQVTAAVRPERMASHSSGIKHRKYSCSPAGGHREHHHGMGGTAAGPHAFPWQPASPQPRLAQRYRKQQQSGARTITPTASPIHQSS